MAKSLFTGKISLALSLLFFSLLPQKSFATICYTSSNHYECNVIVDGVTGLPISSSNPLYIAGTVSASAASDVTATGSISALNANLSSGTATASSAVATATLSSTSTANVVVTGTFSQTLLFQITTDDSNWTSLPQITNLANSTTAASVTGIGNYQVSIPAAAKFRVTSSAYTSGTATVSVRASSGISTSLLPLETGGNLELVATNTLGLNNAVGDATAGLAGNKSLLGGGVYNSSAPTLTNGQQAAFQFDSSANLKVNSSLPTGAATAANQATEITSLATIATNSGTQSTAANQTTANSSLSTIATNTTGVATAANQSTANSSLATIATNSGTQATAANQTTMINNGLKITDGTNIANTLSGDTGQNSLLVSGARKEMTFSGITAASAWIDVSNYRSASFHITAISGNTTIQQSNDASTPITSLITNMSAIPPTNNNVVGATGMYLVNISARYLRILPGTSITVIVEMFSQSQAPMGYVSTAAQSGTWTVQPGNTANTTPWLMAGQAAHAATISGNPIRLGARALTSNYTALTTGQTSDLVSTLVGAAIQKPYSIPEADWNYAAAASGISNTTTAVTIASAAGSGLRNYITGIQLSSDALGAATELAVRDGAGGTVIWRKKIGTAGIVNGINYTFPSPLKSTANTLLEVVTLTASITGAVYFNSQGYIAP